MTLTRAAAAGAVPASEAGLAKSARQVIGPVRVAPLDLKRTSPAGELCHDVTALVVPVSAIILGANARSDWDRDEDGLRLLMESIDQQGILVPLLVKEVSRANGSVRRLFQLVAGFRRYAAAKRLRLTSVPVRVVAANDAEVRATNLAENLAREDLSDRDVICALEDLSMIDGWSVRRIARATGRPASWVSEMLSVARSEPERASVESGQVAVNTAVKLARLRQAAPELHSQFMEKLQAGAHVTLGEVPRLRDVRGSAGGLVQQGASGGVPQVVGTAPTTAREGSDADAAPVTRLTVTRQELSLVRSTRLLLRQVMATFETLRAEQGEARALPAQVAQDFGAMADEIAEFLMREGWGERTRQEALR